MQQETKKQSQTQALNALVHAQTQAFTGLAQSLSQAVGQAVAQGISQAMAQQQGHLYTQEQMPQHQPPRQEQSLSLQQPITGGNTVTAYAQQPGRYPQFPS